MEILWLIIGFLIGLLAAWFYLDGRYKKQSAEREAASGKSGAEIADLREQVRQRDAENKRLESDLAECRAKSADATSLPAAAASAGTAPAFAPSPPASDGPASAAADDLTKIKGIGQVLKGKLDQLGITTFRQIAEFTEADIDRINAVLDFPGRIERERWVEQAREFAR